MLANLDNGTIFKKAFTDIEVFEQFIKDLLIIIIARFEYFFTENFIIEFLMIVEDLLNGVVEQVWNDFIGIEARRNDIGEAVDKL